MMIETTKCLKCKKEFSYMPRFGQSKAPSKCSICNSPDYSGLSKKKIEGCPAIYGNFASPSKPYSNKVFKNKKTKDKTKGKLSETCS